jgi:hypothetical protein
MAVRTICIDMTDEEVARLSGSVVRSVWTDHAGGVWIEDSVETQDGDELASASDLAMSIALRKLLLAISEASKT